MPLFQDGECLPLQRWSELAQTVLFMCACIAASIAIGLIFASIGIDHALRDVCRNGYNNGLLSTFLLALFKPFLETVIAQWLPLFFMKVLKRPPMVQIGFSSVLYAMLHLTDGLVLAVSTFFNGWILASAFVFCQKASWLKAFRVVSTASALQNVILLFGYKFLFGE